MESDTSDEELMSAYSAGDASSFEVLYQRHRAPLYRYILRQTGTPAIAEELYQDVWMKLIKSRENYEVKSQFTTMLYRMAQNRVIDYYRRQQTASGVMVNAEFIDLDSVSTAKTSQPEIRVEQSEAMRRLLTLVERLPEDQKQAFMLREEAGLTVPQIAEVMGVNTENAKSRLRYAMKKLKEGLEEYEPG